MTSIITYASVIERIKEMGLIGSGISHLSNAETFIIGSSVGIICIAIIFQVLNNMKIVIKMEK